KALEASAEQRTDLRGAVIGGASLVEDEGLGQQRAENAARELGEDVDEPVDRVDPAERDERGGDGGIEMPAARHADADDQGEQDQEVREADDGEVGPELGVRAGGHVE